MTEVGQLFIDPNIVRQNFPFTPRPGQEGYLKTLAEALARPEIRFVVGQLPTGSGKSPLAISLAQSVPSAFILTSNKALQDQYLRDFRDTITDLRGRGNYSCDVTKDKNCNDAPCRKTSVGRKKCAENAACGYHRAVESAAFANICSLNFSAGLSFMNYHKDFAYRDLLIIDEAHLIEENLTSFIEFIVTREQLHEFGVLTAAEIIPNHETAASYLPWIRMLMDTADDISERDAYPGDWEKFEGFHRKIRIISEELERNPANLVLDKELSQTGNVMKLSFRPLNVSSYAKEKLFDRAEKCILLSATIVNYPLFIKSLGIDPSECVFIDVPSTFPKENRPISLLPVGKFNMANMDACLPMVAKVISAIMDQKHPKDKGIIHLSSYELGDRIWEHLPPRIRSRILYPKAADQQRGILLEHRENDDPTVLMSPSMAEGVDLKDDLSRFQIIVKMPYPSLGDKVVKARMALDRHWYPTKTMLKIIQMYGRSVRSPDDKAVTYILDENFVNTYTQVKSHLPKWFREAVDG